MKDQVRTEHDTMGDMQVPASALYGHRLHGPSKTCRSAVYVYLARLSALGLIKSVRAKINGQMGHLPLHLAAAIEAAAEQVMDGHHDAEFPVDVFQTGNGTSTNMNANEVIGHLTHAHPNDHVNRGQSSNDVFPTAMHIAVTESVMVQRCGNFANLWSESLKSSTAS